MPTIWLEKKDFMELLPGSYIVSSVCDSRNHPVIIGYIAEEVPDREQQYHKIKQQLKKYKQSDDITENRYFAVYSSEKAYKSTLEPLDQIDISPNNIVPQLW